LIVPSQKIGVKHQKITSVNTVYKAVNKSA